MSKELYKKHRPTKLKQVLGQNVATKLLQNWIKKGSLPHTILITGPSGTGKTTIGRILRRLLNCSKYDYLETNGADKRSIDDARYITRSMYAAPMGGKCRIYLIDECHRMTGDAQSELLKALEDTPRHVYFILATTDPTKLLKAIRTRCTKISLKPLNYKSMNRLLMRIIKKERKKISDIVIDKIILCSEGSAREALVFLNSVINLSDEKDMLNAIETSTIETQTIQIARMLFNPRTKWGDATKLLSKVENDAAEQIRYLILAYARRVILSNNFKVVSRAYAIITAFEDNFFDSKAAGLVAACYSVIVGT